MGRHLNRLFDLETVLRSNDWLMETLALCRDRLPVTAYVGAGAIRNLVWDRAHGLAPAPSADIDVVYFDAAMARGADADFARLLQDARPESGWDVTNQAHVHVWYREYFGKDVPPLATLTEAIATWPDTATAIAVRLDADGRLDVIAPFGLDDLFELVLRWNPSRIGFDDFSARIRSKRWLSRWPGLRVLPRP